MMFNLAQQLQLSHCALPHQSELQMNVVRGLTMQKQMGGIKYFRFCHFLKKKLCFIVYIVTLLLEFVPYCPMYLFHHVRCIGDLYLQTLCCWILPRKRCMTSWQEKSLLVCLRSSLSAYPLVFLFVSIFSPIKFCHLGNEAIPVLSGFLFHFALLILWNLTREKNLPILCCNGSGHAGYYCSF